MRKITKLALLTMVKLNLLRNVSVVTEIMYAAREEVDKEVMLQAHMDSEVNVDMVRSSFENQVVSGEAVEHMREKQCKYRMGIQRWAWIR